MEFEKSNVSIKKLYLRSKYDLFVAEKTIANKYLKVYLGIFFLFFHFLVSEFR